MVIFTRRLHAAGSVAGEKNIECFSRYYGAGQSIHWRKRSVISQELSQKRKEAAPDLRNAPEYW